MGGSSSKCSKRGNIFIDLQQPSFHAGQYVTGTINVQVNETYEGKCLFIAVEGKEKVKHKWETGSGDNRRRHAAKEKGELFQ
jgi:hypothetical protein